MRNAIKNNEEILNIDLKLEPDNINHFHIIVHNSDILQKLKSFLNLFNKKQYTISNFLKISPARLQNADFVMLISEEKFFEQDYEFIHSIKNHFKTLPIIMLTAKLNVDKKLILYSAGINAIINLHIPPEELVIILNKIILISKKLQILEIQNFELINMMSEIRKTNELLKKEIKKRKKLQKERDKYWQQIIQTEKIASIGELAANISHEINNPLAIMLVKAEQLKRLINHSQIDINLVQEAAESIINLCLRIAKIISGLKKLSRSSDENHSIETTIKNILDETLSFCNEALAKKKIQIKFENIENLPTIKCLPTQLVQVFLNLINNAKDALIETTVVPKEIIIKGEEYEDKIKIYIHDNGKDIPENIRKKIFDPFYSTKPPSNGTGLGLSISKKIIEAHNGKIYLDYSSGKKNFVIELPKTK